MPLLAVDCFRRLNPLALPVKWYLTIAAAGAYGLPYFFILCAIISAW